MTEVCTYCREREASYRMRGSAWLCCSLCFERRPMRIRQQMVPTIIGNKDRSAAAFAVVVGALCAWVLAWLLVGVLR